MRSRFLICLAVNAQNLLLNTTRGIALYILAWIIKACGRMDFISALFGIIVGMGLMMALILLKRDLLYTLIAANLKKEALQELKDEIKDDENPDSSKTDKTSKK